MSPRFSEHTAPRLGQAYSPQGLISRVADCCFWFGRYVERAESTARELVATAHLHLDGELLPRQCWHPVVIVSGEEARFVKRFGDAALSDAERVQAYLVWDDAVWVSLRQSVAGARENARAIREVITGEVWETVNELHLWLNGDAARSQYEHDRDGFYRRVRQMTQLTLGLLRSTMLHDTPLDFIWLGVMLERTNQTARLLDVHHHAFTAEVTGPEGIEATETHQVVQTAVWLTLLRALSGYESFARSFVGRVSAETVAEFLIVDPRFPRSIAYCVHAAHERFCYLRPPGDTHLPGGATLERLAALKTWVSELPEDLLDAGGLHAVLTHIVDESTVIADLMGRELLGRTPSTEPAPESESESEEQSTPAPAAPGES